MALPSITHRLLLLPSTLFRTPTPCFFQQSRYQHHHLHTQLRPSNGYLQQQQQQKLKQQATPWLLSFPLLYSSTYLPTSTFFSPSAALTNSAVRRENSETPKPRTNTKLKANNTTKQLNNTTTKGIVKPKSNAIVKKSNTSKSASKSPKTANSKPLKVKKVKKLTVEERKQKQKEERAKEKKKKERELKKEKPKKPTNAFSFFFKENYDEIRQNVQSGPVTKVMSLAHKLYSELPDKSKYIALAQKDAERYAREKQEYDEAHPKREPNPYAQYVRSNFSRIKKENPDASTREIIAQLAKGWQIVKQQ